MAEKANVCVEASGAVDSKKLDKWAELLLDTGRRNNLVHFKDTKTSTAEVLLPPAEELFDKAADSALFEVFDPEILEEEDTPESPDPQQPHGSALKASEPLDKKAAFLARYSKEVDPQNQVLLYNAQKNPLAAVKRIAQRARAFTEETGVNVAYMAFGFIHWKESDASACVFRAPVLLVPIQLERDSEIDPFFIKPTEDDVIVNPTFSYKMDAEHGVKLPEYHGEGLLPYLEKVTHIVERLQWTVTPSCRIGIFSFLKINMYRDLKDNVKAILANRNVRLLLGESNDAMHLSDGDEAAAPLSNPLIALHSVVDADSSQIEAIQMAKQGNSFVLQGPPGTGKSQTITNIIAECLSDGKRILFVSAKLAALNVVYDKLKQAGLADFCLQLHSHKANKKDVIAELCYTLRADKTSVSAKADSEIAVKERAQRQLDAYAEELHKPRPGIAKSLYQLYEAYSAFRSVPDVAHPIANLSSKGHAYLMETVPLLEQYVDYLPSIGYDYKKNPWYGYINRDTSYQSRAEVKSVLSSAVQFLHTLIPLQQEISEKYGVQCASIQDARVWNTFFAFAAASNLLTPPLLNPTNFELANSALRKLHAQSSDVLSARSLLAESFDDDVYNLDGAECYKKLTKLFASPLSRLFSADYQQLVTAMRLCSKNGKKPSYSHALAAAQCLSRYQQKIAEYAQIEAPIKPFMGAAYNGAETDWDALLDQMSALANLLSAGISFDALSRYDDFASQRDAFAHYHQQLESAFAICDAHALKCADGYFDHAVLNVHAAPSTLVLDRFIACMDQMDKLDNWRHFRDLLSKLDDKQALPYINEAIDHNVDPKHIVGAFQKQFYYQWIDSVIAENPILSAFNRVSQDKAIRTFSEKDTEQFEINKAKIRASLSSMRPPLDSIVPGSALFLLLREGEKKRNQKNIRSLLAQTGKLVQLLKPCFLMSPLSVSTYLAPGAVHFDVVIFDEASQIFPQDAIGAIYRAKQLIVVGDSKQMPPSNFFNASVDSEDHDDDAGDVTDFESILDLCSASMRQLRLRWHYRSRCEQLIAFSNKNFYDGDLVTFPSSKADAPGIGVDYYHVDGIFDRKTHTNRKEAEFVVDLIYQNIEKYPDRSLGVVAFSVAQQDLIDELLSKQRQASPQKEFFFKNNASAPFFVKNLETVQGDERDTIIFSVAYGVDAQGRLMHNFGPLNRMGGERRLNVAATRAKCNVQLVSSMYYTDIDLNRTSAEGARLLREYLDYAQNGALALERAVSVGAFEQFDSEFELEVYDYLKSKGFSVDTQVGCSGFRIDLALKLPGSSDYVLAIECDGATYHSSKNARDRDRLRQQILEGMGWKFYRIWSTDWFRNKSVEQLRLLDAAADAVKSPSLARVQPVPIQPVESFKEIAAENHFEFPPYKAADFLEVCQRHPYGEFMEIVKEILEVEAPLSEDLFLKRIVWYFGRKRVTTAVLCSYEQQMCGCQQHGIIRKNGFLYLDNDQEIQFRIPGDIERDIKQIAPEELAAGMFSILKHNVTADKSGLYHSLAAHCGVARVGSAINEAMDSALDLLKQHIIMDGEQLSLK